MTNGDVLRAMSNEELAKFLAEERARLAKPIFDRLGFGIETQVMYAKILPWLNEEADADSGSV